MSETRRLTVRARFCGPPGVGNGGYVAGVLAAPLDEHAEVRLLRPTPVDVPLALQREGGGWLLGVETTGEVVATSHPAKPVLSLVAPPPSTGLDLARAASERAPAHPFPGCFVCGPARGHGDGLRVLTGPLEPGRFDVVAGPWTPDDSLRGSGLEVDARFVWAALDCPGAIAAMDGRMQPMLLARMTGELFEPVRVGERCVAVGWRIARDGRKHTTGTALYGEDGSLRGASEQLWIEPRRSASAA
jgi:hypothetical protein